MYIIFSYLCSRYWCRVIRSGYTVKGNQVQVLNRPAAVSLTEMFSAILLSLPFRVGRPTGNRDKSENLPVTNKKVDAFVG